MERHGRTGKGFFTVRTISILGGAAIFAFLVVYIGPFVIVRRLESIGWGFLIIFLVYLSEQLIRVAAFRLSIEEAPYPTFPELFRIWISGEAVQILTFTGPFLGAPMKAWLLEDCGVHKDVAFAASVGEYVIYTVISSAVALAGMLYLVTHFTLNPILTTASWVIIWGLLVMVVMWVAAALFRIHIFWGIVRELSRLPWIRKHYHPDRGVVPEMDERVLILLRGTGGRLAKIVIAELSTQVLLMFEIWYLLKAMELTFPLIYPFLIESEVKFIGLVFFFIPNQIGAAEAIFAVIFHSLGLTASAGFTMSFVRRMRSFAFAGIGLLVMARYERRHASRASEKRKRVVSPKKNPAGPKSHSGSDSESEK